MSPPFACVVHARCEVCRDITVTTRDVTVRICADTGVYAYVLRCPHCGGVVARTVQASLGDLLVIKGAEFVFWSLPAELSEPHVGPPLTVDDAIDFHRQLESDTWGVA